VGAEEAEGYPRQNKGQRGQKDVSCWDKSGTEGGEKVLACK